MWNQPSVCHTTTFCGITNLLYVVIPQNVVLQTFCMSYYHILWYYKPSGLNVRPLFLWTHQPSDRITHELLLKVKTIHPMCSKPWAFLPCVFLCVCFIHLLFLSVQPLYLAADLRLLRGAMTDPPAGSDAGVMPTGLMMREESRR